MQQSAIAAISTPLAAGGIAALRISGTDAPSIAAAVFAPARQPLDQMKGYTAAYGHFIDAEGVAFDEGVCLVYRAPHSYTGEDVVELFCHGGVYLAQKVLELLLQNGAQPAGPGEFTRRAFENGKLDLTAAEAVMNLISASGEAVLREAYLAKSGKLHQKLSELEQLCIEMSASIVAYIDYPDEDVQPPALLASQMRVCLDGVQKLLDGYENGRVFRAGLNTVILGRPNAGKSALMNSLAGTQRSIVTPVAGTTRDVVCETVRLGQLLLNVSDTAGIRRSQDMIEQIGVEKAKELLQSAELILAVFDGSEPLTDGDREVIALTRNRPCVCIVNKADLPQAVELTELEAHFKHIVRLCALDGAGLDSLEREITGLFAAKPATEAVIFNPRQKLALQKARAALQAALDDLQNGAPLDAVSVGIEEALSCFGEITGKNIPQSVIDEVFAKFCVGK